MHAAGQDVEIAFHPFGDILKEMPVEDAGRAVQLVLIREHIQKGGLCGF